MLLVASISSIASEVIRIRYAYGFCHWLRIDSSSLMPLVPMGFSSVGIRPNSIRSFRMSCFSLREFFYQSERSLRGSSCVILLVGTVFLVQPVVALGSIIIFGGFYLIVFLWIRPRSRNGSEMSCGNITLDSGKNVNQFLHGIRQCSSMGGAVISWQERSPTRRRSGKLRVRIPIYSGGTRYMIEPIAFGGLVTIVIVLALQGRPFSDIPTGSLGHGACCV